jgi:hypothetical protein
MFCLQNSQAITIALDQNSETWYTTSKEATTMATNTLSPATGERMTDYLHSLEEVWAVLDKDPLPDNFAEVCEGEDLEPIWSSK